MDIRSSTVLYLSYDGLTDNLGRSQIIPYLNILSNEGFKIIVISAEKKVNYKKNLRFTKRQLSDHIEWHPTFYTSRPPILSTFYDLFKMERKAHSILSSHTVDIVHVRSYPPMPMALRLKKRHSVKVLFDMRGFYAEERLEGDIWSMDNPVHRILFNRLKKQEKKFFLASDYIISLTQKAKDILSKDYSINPEKISIIPCCADFSHFNILEDTSVAKSAGLRVVYLGSLGTWYLMKETLEFFSRILQHFPDSHLTILSSDDPSLVTSLLDELSIASNRVRIYSTDRNELPGILSQMDLSIFFIKPSYSKLASSPTKLAELLACGVPVVCNSEVGDLNELSQKVIGLNAVKLDSLATLDVPELIDSLLTLDQKAIRNSAKELFDLPVAIEVYLECYELLTKNNGQEN